MTYMFGFPPRESVVVLGLAGQRVKAAARVDVAAVADPADAALLGRLGAVAVPGRSVVVMGWSDDAVLAQQAAQRVATALGGVDQVIVVSGGRCRAGDGPWEDCPDSLPAAECAGLTVLPDRAALAAQVAGPDAGDPQAAERWLTASAGVWRMGLPARRERALRLVDGGLSDPAALSADELVELAALVSEGAVRDELWCRLTRRVADAHVGLWMRVVGLVPDAGAPAVLGLLGMAAWVAGNGALQVCCLERGMALAPSHSLLRLVECVNVLGLEPAAWARLRRSLGPGAF